MRMSLTVLEVNVVLGKLFLKIEGQVHSLLAVVLSLFHAEKTFNKNFWDQGRRKHLNKKSCKQYLTTVAVCRFLSQPSGHFLRE